MLRDIALDGSERFDERADIARGVGGSNRRGHRHFLLAKQALCVGGRLQLSMTSRASLWRSAASSQNESPTTVVPSASHHRRAHSPQHQHGATSLLRWNVSTPTCSTQCGNNQERQSGAKSINLPNSTGDAAVTLVTHANPARRRARSSDHHNHPRTQAMSALIAARRDQHTPSHRLATIKRIASAAAQDRARPRGVAAYVLREGWYGDPPRRPRAGETAPGSHEFDRFFCVGYTTTRRSWSGTTTRHALDRRERAGVAAPSRRGSRGSPSRSRRT